ncbi:hypothetical protein [Baekduia sp.]|uniref:hypothetical protein n=1 Tax=Baekduia sp. TaxID=2600305 RepID=UPI002E0BB22A|nr:hypothetical protein [Baekduia sp.]
MRVMHLGVTEATKVDEVLDDGRTLVVGTDTFTLRRINGWFVRREEPYYGTRLLLGLSSPSENPDTM